MTADPRSLLFLSCDITGSTAYKQQAGSQWQRTFLSFYREFPQQLGEKVADAGSPVEFTLWKAIGDELIFTCHVRNEPDVFNAVRIWLQAMDGYEESTLREHRLGTKGGAFLATFPGPDSECSIPRNPSSETSDKGIVALNREALEAHDMDAYQYDYFGPSIDTGFRVVNRSSARHFTLAVEVAWAMQRCQHDAKDNGAADPLHKDLGDICLLGSFDLKGVWRGRPYPLFALDRQIADPVHEALRALDGTTCDLDAVGAACAACCGSDGWPSAIYLPESNFPPFKNVPTDPLEAQLDNEMEGAEEPPPGEDAGSETGELTDEAPVG